MSENQAEFLHATAGRVVPCHVWRLAGYGYTFHAAHSRFEIYHLFGVKSMAIHPPKRKYESGGFVIIANATRS